MHKSSVKWMMLVAISTFKGKFNLQWATLVTYHLYNVKLLGKEIWYFYSETTNVKRIYICISHWNFIVIRSETNEKIDL